MLLAALQALTYTVALLPLGTTPPATAPVAVLATFPESALVCGTPGPPQAGAFRLQGIWDGRVCETPLLPLVGCETAPCPVYDVFVEAVNEVGRAWSLAATPPLTTTLTVDPACLWPLGNRAVSVFPLGVTATNGRAGAQAIQNFQLASPNSPITEVLLRVDGRVVETIRGENLTRLPGWWLTLPPTGTHPVTIQATNAAGCTREAAARPLVVP